MKSKLKRFATRIFCAVLLGGVASYRLAEAAGNAAEPVPQKASQDIPWSFSDANWISLNPSIPGPNGSVYAAVMDGSGNLYIGGSFSVAGATNAYRIAKWNGSSWSALGSGIS